MMTQLFKSILVGLTVLFLASCGQSVCVMGIGQCDAPDKPTSALTLTANPTSLSVKGGTSTITVSGGTSQFTFHLFYTNCKGGGISNENVSSSSLTTTYTAPQGSGKCTATIEVHDSSSPPEFKAVNISIDIP
jgi:hypothetical protein